MVYFLSIFIFLASYLFMYVSIYVSSHAASRNISLKTDWKKNKQTTASAQGAAGLYKHL